MRELLHSVIEKRRKDVAVERDKLLEIVRDIEDREGKETKQFNLRLTDAEEAAISLLSIDLAMTPSSALRFLIHAAMKGYK